MPIVRDPIHFITVTGNPDPAHLQRLGVTSWPTWGCGVSTFPWSYDEQETCLLLEGDVTVTPDDGEPVRIGAGDLVVFDAGLSCTWDVHVPVRKHACGAGMREANSADRLSAAPIVASPCEIDCSRASLLRFASRPSSRAIR